MYKTNKQRRQREKKDTMAEFRWIKLSLIVMLARQFTAAAGQRRFSTVRDGDAATLSRENVIDGQNDCDGTTWVFNRLKTRDSIELITLGQIGENAKNISDRLRVLPNCSLVIKKVIAEDAGAYFCQQYKSGQQQNQEPPIYLSFVTMTEYEDTDEVKLTCSVSTYERCLHTVKWQYNGDGMGDEVKTSQSSCSATLHLQTDSYIYESRFTSLKCAVTDDNSKVQRFAFNRQPPGEGTVTTTTEGGSNATIITNAPVINDALTTLKGLWWLGIIAAVLLVALLIVVVKVITMKRTAGNKKRTNDKVGLTSNSAVTQSTGQDMAAPEAGISYATISYTRTTDSKGQVRSRKDETEDNIVTYMTVKVSSTDPIDVYATVNKP